MIILYMLYNCVCMGGAVPKTYVVVSGKDDWMVVIFLIYSSMFKISVCKSCPKHQGSCRRM